MSKPHWPVENFERETRQSRERRLGPIRPPSPWGRNRTFAKYFQAAVNERPERLRSATPSAAAPAIQAGWTSPCCNGCAQAACCRWCLARQGRLERCDQRRSSRDLDSAARSRWVRRTAHRGASLRGCSHGAGRGCWCCARPRDHSRSSQRLHHQPPCQVMGCPQMSQVSTSLPGMCAPWCCDAATPGPHRGWGSRQGWGVLVLRWGSSMTRGGRFWAHLAPQCVRHYHAYAPLRSLCSAASRRSCPKS